MNGKGFKRPTPFPPAVILLACLVTAASVPAQVTSPEQYVGFRVGEDRRLFGWQTVVDYFQLLDSKSERLSLRELGSTTLGRPFIMALISSPTNLMNVARYKNLQKQAANPGHLSDEDARTLARQNKIVVLLALNIQSTEIASSQASLEIAYSLATENDVRTNLILDNTIILLVPSLNPDGMQLAVDWYNQYLGSSSEGSPMPVLSHHYAGDEIDFDWPMLNLVETRLLAKEIYHEWFPELVYAQYPGTYNGPRLLLPNFTNSGKAVVHDEIIVQSNGLVDQVAEDLRAQGFAGLARSEVEIATLNGTITTSAMSHNMVGFMTRVAPTQMATPIYFPKGSLPEHTAGAHRGLGGNNSFKVWQSGWWRLRDIINYEKAVVFSLLRAAAAERQSIIYNFCKINQSAIEGGGKKSTFAYILHQEQPDHGTSRRLTDALIRSGIDVKLVSKAISVRGHNIKAGSHVIPLAQSFAPHIRSLFEPQRYSDFDAISVPTATLPQTMGVNVVKVELPLQADVTKMDSTKPTVPFLKESKKSNYVISHTSNQAFTLTNRLLNRRKKVFWLKESVAVDGKSFQPGVILISAKEIKHRNMTEHLEGLTIEIMQTDQTFRGTPAFRLNKFKLGLYRPWSANLDEGWTRFVLDQFEFPVKLLYTANVNRDKLADDFDVIVLPDMTQHEVRNGLGSSKRSVFEPEIPEPYRGGISEKGMANLMEFVEEGGVLISLNRTCDFAVDLFGLPVQKLHERYSQKALDCQWALLDLEVDNYEPIAYGMPPNATAMLLDSPAYRTIAWSKRTVIGAFFPKTNLMLGGYCRDSRKMQGLPAVMQMPVGKGRVVLIAFKAQHRGQTAGTYKILFNAIQLAAAEEITLDR